MGVWAGPCIQVRWGNVNGIVSSSCNGNGSWQRYGNGDSYSYTLILSTRTRPPIQSASTKRHCSCSMRTTSGGQAPGFLPSFPQIQRGPSRRRSAQIAMPTFLTDRSDLVLGIRIMLGRGAGVTGVAGALGVVRYTIPVPVLGFSLDILDGGELSPVGLGFEGDTDGKPTPASGGALEAVEVERAVVACGWRNPWEGTWRRLGALDGPTLADRGAQVQGVDVETDVAVEGVRRLPCA